MATRAGILSAMRPPIAVRLLVAVLALVSATASSTTGGARKTKPWTATGRVVDVQGRPVAGAALDVSITNHEYRSVTIGRGVSGADGGFALRLTTNEYGDLGLGVDAPGFAHWGWAGFPRGVADEKIVLHRIIDRPFIEGLRAVRDPAERARRVLEIAASDDLPEIEQMLPYLGELRAELAAIVRAGTTEPRDRRDGSSPSDHAARLLAYWADPADDVLVVPWLKKNWGGRPAHVAHLGLSAASIQDVCDRWREIHFADQGISSPALELLPGASGGSHRQPRPRSVSRQVRLLGLRHAPGDAAGGRAMGTAWGRREQHFPLQALRTVLPRHRRTCRSIATDAMGE